MTIASIDTAAEAAAGGVATQAAAWADFAGAAGSTRFPALWLSLLCGQLAGARSALLLLGEADRGPFTPAAVWPDPHRDVTGLSPAAERTLRERRGLALARNGESGLIDLTYPLLVGEALHGALVVELAAAGEGAVQQALRQIHWGAAGMELELHRRERESAAAANRRVFSVLDLVAAVVEEHRFQAAASALVSELATRLDCDRVSLGLRRGRQMRVQAVSHSASFGRQMNLIRLIEAAMDEAVDQQTRLAYPSTNELVVVAAHQALAQQQGAPEICTLPLRAHGDWAAALTLERPAGRRLADLDADLAATAGELAAPLLLCKREEERWIAAKIGLSVREQLKRLFGPKHLGRKLVAVGVLAVVAFFVFAKGQYRVSADATLEGGELRALVAPFAGYIETAEARAGEQVAAGELLATLDDRDLKLEQVRLSTEQAQYRRERRQAAAEGDRARVRILTAQIEQAEAQLALIDAQLARTRLTAPFDGILVSGDLSQSLGAPVQQGDVLFEVAPADAYRVQLAVAEGDIDDLAVGQTGTLVLAALPEQRLPMEVTLITPVASVVDGRNSFAVEARLTETPKRLRPGMEGVGKIDIGERRLIWIWTRGFLDWARLKLWAWWP